MLKMIIASAVALGLASSAFAATTTTPTTTTTTAAVVPPIQYSRDNNYIYVHQPLRLTLDAEQQAALQDGIQLISKQLQNLNAQTPPDPSGDLKAISDATTALSQKLDLLVQLSGQLYGEVAPFGVRAFEALPTGLLLFGTIGVDKGILKFLSAGGSVTAAVVLVPMSEQRITIKNPSEVVSRIYWDTSLVAMVVGNAAVGVLSPTAAANPATARGGVGIIWGELNSATDFHGIVGGPSITMDVLGGLNVKLLGLKNLDKPGAVNNYVLMAGVERGNLQIETHGNVGVVLDAKAALGGTVSFVEDTATRISGKASKPAAN
jgi:hypothetical protein